MILNPTGCVPNYSGVEVFNLYLIGGTNPISQRRAIRRKGQDENIDLTKHPEPALLATPKSQTTNNASAAVMAKKALLLLDCFEGLDLDRSSRLRAFEQKILRGRRLETMRVLSQQHLRDIVDRGIVAIKRNLLDTSHALFCTRTEKLRAAFSGTMLLSQWTSSTEMLSLIKSFEQHLTSPATIDPGKYHSMEEGALRILFAMAQARIDRDLDNLKGGQGTLIHVVTTMAIGMAKRPSNVPAVIEGRQAFLEEQFGKK